MIDDKERQRRYDLVTDTMGSWALEGMEPTEYALDLTRRYVNGEAELDDLKTEVRARYGLH